jgi:hypothetical protein
MEEGGVASATRTGEQHRHMCTLEQLRWPRTRGRSTKGRKVGGVLGGASRLHKGAANALRMQCPLESGDARHHEEEDWLMEKQVY